MRKLNSNEKKIVKHLVEARKNNRYEQMQFAYIIKHFVTYDYICWNKKDYNSYIKTFLHGNNSESREVFYKIVDIIGLFMELQEKGYIFLAGTKLSPLEYPVYHYDKSKIENFLNSGLLVWKGNKLQKPVENEGDEYNIYYGEIVEIIEKYMNSIIYPLQSLIDYERNFYTSVEQRRFCMQSIISIIAIIIAIWLAIPAKDDEQKKIEQITSAIKELKTPATDSTTVQQFDTLEIKVLAPHSLEVKPKVEQQIVPVKKTEMSQPKDTLPIK